MSLRNCFEEKRVSCYRFAKRCAILVCWVKTMYLCKLLCGDHCAIRVLCIIKTISSNGNYVCTWKYNILFNSSVKFNQLTCRLSFFSTKFLGLIGEKQIFISIRPEEIFATMILLFFYTRELVSRYKKNIWHVIIIVYRRGTNLGESRRKIILHRFRRSPFVLSTIL